MAFSLAVVADLLSSWWTSLFSWLRNIHETSGLQNRSWVKQKLTPGLSLPLLSFRGLGHSLAKWSSCPNMKQSFLKVNHCLLVLCKWLISYRPSLLTGSLPSYCFPGQSACLGPWVYLMDFPPHSTSQLLLVQ